MGAKTSKHNDRKHSTERSDKNQQIALLFSASNADKTEITKDKLKELWHNYLTHNLLMAILNVLYEHKKSYILFDEFTNFYWQSCEISSEKEAELIIKLVKTNENRLADETSLLSLISEFIESYFQICTTEKDSLFNDWKKFGSFNKNACGLAEYILSNMDDKSISLDAVNSLITNNPMFRIITHHIYKTMFNTISLEDKRTLFPKVVIRSNCVPILSPSELLFIQWNIGQKSRHKWRLLFSVESDGQSWSTFLKAILGQGPTLIVVQDTSGYKFGGFASKSWNTNPNFYGDEDCFLFTILPKLNVFEASGYNRNFQYINTGQATLPNGLAMGGVHNYWGLFLNSDFGKGLVADTCTTYKNYEKLSSEKEFTIDRLQVWAVGTPDPTPQQLGERGTSILDKDPSAAAILELAGRPLHSTEIRKIKDEE